MMGINCFRDKTEKRFKKSKFIIKLHLRLMSTDAFLATHVNARK